MKKVIHNFSSYASKWYSIALVVLIAQYALDGHSPGFGALGATTYSVVQNLVMSLCVGMFWSSIMSAVSKATRTRYVLNTSESTKLLNEILKKATNKNRLISVERNIMKNIFTKMINKLLGLFTSTDEFDFKNHVYKEYYKNGKLKREKPYVRGKKHGIEKEYYESGQLLYEIPYKKGKRHGTLKAYYTNGKLEYEKSYKNGKKHGIWKEYNEHGKPIWELSYKNDERHGISKTYHMNGQLLKEEMWVNDYSD